MLLHPQSEMLSVAPGRNFLLRTPSVRDQASDVPRLSEPGGHHSRLPNSKSGVGIYTSAIGFPLSCPPTMLEADPLTLAIKTVRQEKDTDILSEGVGLLFVLATYCS